LAWLLGIGVTLSDISYVKKLNSPSTYFIHCDLLDKTKNFLNGNRSDVLVRFDIKGLLYVKVSYNSTPQQVLRDCSTDAHVNSITVSVKDEHGKLFDFKGMPLEFDSANVLPSAPSEEPLYPVLMAPAENFHLQKIDEMAEFLDQEVGHHRLIA